RHSPLRVRSVKRRLPARELTDSIYWVGGCRKMVIDDQPVHHHQSAYLVVGAEHTLLVDTSTFPNSRRDSSPSTLGERSRSAAASPTSSCPPRPGTFPARSGASSGTAA